MSRWLTPAITLISLLLYWLAVALQNDAAFRQQQRPPEIVIAAPVLVLMFGGDRFLAANLNAIRAATAATALDAHDFRLRTHYTVSQLNPCHEDNYWVGNASLTWGGAVDQGFALLRNAMHCRFWDEWPAFFYGFNEHFFRDNISEARRSLEIAAQRSSANAAVFRTFSTMIAAGKIDNTSMALEWLTRERDEARDPALREMLDKRVLRLKGLLTLREAQTAFESRFNKPLTHPQELIENGVLDNYPEDPLQLGYEFRDGAFHLRQMKIE